ncbi:hypothetical protein ACFPVX_09980 [Cohnella faecalis]|uniref:Uncharacterized protein n=1 Tax=Cohnella faecalis TaxID=2315694 RepID=A0A398CZ23_9BACL|nr:hypothetical protein [Cohnella faecalis]RIE05097.1 hypothetical protein D3H35_02910 [Cohnella faecalis]
MSAPGMRKSLDQPFERATKFYKDGILSGRSQLAVDQGNHDVSIDGNSGVNTPSTLKSGREGFTSVVFTIGFCSHSAIRRRTVLTVKRDK